MNIGNLNAKNVIVIGLTNMWYPMSVNPQTRINNGYFKTEGYVCVNIELRMATTHVHSTKTFAYSECAKLNGNPNQLKLGEINEGRTS
jgi:hypothetical protein